jgi:methylthioxylose transferase
MTDEQRAEPEASHPGPAGRGRWEHHVLLLLAVVAFWTVVVGYVEGARKDAYGTATPPFVFGWVPEIDPWAAVAVVVLGAVAVLGPRLLSPRVPSAAVAPALFVMALAAGLSLSAARTGTHGWWAIFDLGDKGSFEAINEYLPGLPLLHDGVGNYLDRFAETVPSQTVNVAGHPPGPLLLMHALGIDTAQGLAALCIVGAALCAPLTYAIARVVGRPSASGPDGADDARESAARTAGLVAVVTPVMLLDGFTSFDAVFAAIGAAAAALLLSRRPVALAAGAVVFGIATIFSWALLGVGAAVAIAVLFRDGWRRAVVVAGIAGAGFLGINLLLAIGWGYDPVGTLRATEEVYRSSVATVRPYRFWLFGSPVAWGLLVGPVVIAAAVRAAMRRSPVAIAILGVVVIAALAGFTKAETERIWLIFVPLVCVAAAPLLTRRRLPLVLGALAAQALALQLLVDTVW